MTYKVIDEITGELLEFKNKYDAETEVERRILIHRTGYHFSVYTVKPVKVDLKTEGKVYRICLKK